jgi:nicotinamidase-related amidase
MELILENSIGSGKLQAARTAVLGIHWQVDAVKPEGAFGPIFAQTVIDRRVIENTARVFNVARAHRIPIIYVNVCFWPGFADLVRNNALFNTVSRNNAFVRGTPGAAVINELAPLPGDYIFEHSRISAFYGTDLMMTLTGLKIETLVFTGVATNVAVDHSVRDAAQLGFSTILLTDCCCSSSQAYDDAALLTLKVLSTQVTDSDVFCKALETDTNPACR